MPDSDNMFGLFWRTLALLFALADIDGSKGNTMFSAVMQARAFEHRHDVRKNFGIIHSPDKIRAKYDGARCVSERV